jgi:uncharacterized tellurite resistance protein B-like protein
LNDKIALGVLLWVVAEADDKFLPQERQQIEAVLKQYGQISDDDLAVVMEAVKQAAEERIDLHTFTHEVAQGLPYQKRVEMIETLFRVACADKELAHEEEEAVRKISGLFLLDHKDYINAKIKVKQEFGLDVSGL